jgi:prepilin-type N-terminal cleavage/methylation domain-containing protein
MEYRIEKSTQKEIGSFPNSKFQIQNSTQKGFTVLELLIVVSIMGLLAAIILAPFATFRNSKVLDTASEEALALLSEARGDTLSAKEGYQYGVHFEATQIVLYRGATYSSSDANNKVVLLDSAIEISSITLTGGGAEVLFDRLTGKTSQGGTVVIRVKSDTAKSRTITIFGTGIASCS